MKEMLLPVKVSAGLFSSERVASFSVAERHYCLVVDAGDIAGDFLRVFVLESKDGEALVQLPRETFTTGSRVMVPLDTLHEGRGE